MRLPETSGLSKLSADRWRALGAWLAELGVAEAYGRVAAVGGDLFEPACMPLRRWHLRRSGRPVDHAVRMFCADDPVTDDECRSALGPFTIDELCDAGLLVRRAPEDSGPHGDGGGLVSPFRLREHEGVQFFSDHLWHGGDAVMGAGPLTGALLRAATPKGSIESALDLGCGAGFVALSLARRAGRVVATDINPRAAGFVRANAALNGLSNIDVRTGDLFATVAGERFDRVACQPPFFPAPPDSAGTVYSQGGRRGDELPRRVLRGVGEHLSPGGRAVVIAEWPVLDDEPLADRVRAVVGPSMNLLLVEAEGPDVDVFCIGDTSYSHPDFGPEFRRKAIAMREHMEAIGVRGLRAALSVVEPAPAGAAGWTGTFEVADLTSGAVTPALIDSLVAARSLIHAGREALLGARLCLREGTVFASGKDDALLRVLFMKGGPISEIKLDRAAHRIVELVDGSPDGHAAAKRYAKESSGPRSAAMDRFASAVEKMLLAGILEVASRR